VEEAAEDRRRTVAVAVRPGEAGALATAVVVRDVRDRLGGLDVRKGRLVVQRWQWSSRAALPLLPGRPKVIDLLPR